MLSKGTTEVHVQLATPANLTLDLALDLRCLGYASNKLLLHTWIDCFNVIVHVMV